MASNQTAPLLYPGKLSPKTYVSGAQETGPTYLLAGAGTLA
jgi:hypothetical protein